jgi:hypothetical protein
MFIQIPILILLAFAAVYPLYFCIPFSSPWKYQFRKFSIVLPNVAGGAVLIAVWVLNIPLYLKLIVSLWKVSLLSVSRYSWKKQYPAPKLMVIPCLFGAYAVYSLKVYFGEPVWDLIISSVLAGLTACGLYLRYQFRNNK